MSTFIILSWPHGVMHIYADAHFKQQLV